MAIWQQFYLAQILFWTRSRIFLDLYGFEALFGANLYLFILSQDQ